MSNDNSTNVKEDDSGSDDAVIPGIVKRVASLAKLGVLGRTDVWAEPEDVWRFELRSWLRDAGTVEEFGSRTTISYRPSSSKSTQTLDGPVAKEAHRRGSPSSQPLHASKASPSSDWVLTRTCFVQSVLLPLDAVASAMKDRGKSVTVVVQESVQLIEDSLRQQQEHSQHFHWVDHHHLLPPHALAPRQNYTGFLSHIVRPSLKGWKDTWQEVKPVVIIGESPSSGNTEVTSGRRGCSRTKRRAFNKGVWGRASPSHVAPLDV